MRNLLLFVIQVSLVWGHGDLDEQISKVSAQLKTHPEKPGLWLTRAILHQSHRDLPAALADLQIATRIRPPYPPAFLKLAQFQRKQDKITEARATLGDYFSILSGEAPDPEAFREKALLSEPRDALNPWSRYLNSKAQKTMHDYLLAAQAGLEAKRIKEARYFLLEGLERHPKSIPLHQTHARISLTEKDLKSAGNSFQILELLYPNLLVTLNYEESRIWTAHQYPARALQALHAALKAYHKLPARLQKNPDLQRLVARIQTALPK